MIQYCLNRIKCLSEKVCDSTTVDWYESSHYRINKLFLCIVSSSQADPLEER